MGDANAIRIDQEDNIIYTFVFTNFGPIPGSSLNIKWDILVNSVKQPSTIKFKQENGIIFPGERKIMNNPIPKEHFSGIIKGTSIFEIKTEIFYKGSRV